jgi:hypothetical protein
VSVEGLFCFEDIVEIKGDYRPSFLYLTGRDEPIGVTISRRNGDEESVWGLCTRIGEQPMPNYSDLLIAGFSENMIILRLRSQQWHEYSPTNQAFAQRQQLMTKSFDKDMELSGQVACDQSCKHRLPRENPLFTNTIIGGAILNKAVHQKWKKLR